MSTLRGDIGDTFPRMSAVESLARAEVEMESGFTSEALTYALMALAYSTLSPEDQDAATELAATLKQNRKRAT